MSTTDIPEHAVAAARERVERFVLRARRIEAHSLAEDLDKLIALGQAKMNFEVFVNNETEEVVATKGSQELPPEEQLESLAARVRPLLLNDDLLYYAVLKSMKTLTHQVENPRLRAALQTLRDNWKRHIEPTREAAYIVQVEASESAPARYVDDSALASAWLYGDVVHASVKSLQEAEGIDVRERYRAAAPLIARVALAAIGLLNVVRGCQEGGLLGLSEKAFIEEVVVGDQPFEFDAQISHAPPGTRMPDPGEELGPDWTPLGPDFLNPS